MRVNTRISATVSALLAAAFYAISTPVSKVLLNNVGPTVMAALLYLGAGFGVGIMYMLKIGSEAKTERLTRSDIPYTIGMILLDIAAPILLMKGIDTGSAANASLLGNFEIVATTLIALLIFKEKVTARLWAAVTLITVSGIILSFEGVGSLNISWGSLLVIAATMCWGLENNCTRKISSKSTYEIVVLKGFFSGCGSLVTAFFLGEKMPRFKYLAAAMLLGFVAYGLSIFMYVRAQRVLGAAKTSAYYATAPFIGMLLAFVVNGERPTRIIYIGAVFMLAGTIFVVYDTMLKHHVHMHTHTIVHTHDGSTHTHTVQHEHGHDHFLSDEKHAHHHDDFMFSEEHRAMHKAVAED